MASRAGTFVLPRALAASVFGLAVSRAPSVRAQNAADQAAAEALFDQGKAAMGQRNYAEACPKFYESNRLDEGIGTSLWLADCYEKNGQTASAWAQFREAASLAVKSSDPREKVARARAQALEPRLAKLTLVVPQPARLPGIRVARDGGEVATPVWGTAVPIDPGRHTVVVSAPDHRPQTLTVQIKPGPSHQNLEIPVLEEAPTPVVVADGAPAPSTDGPLPTSASRGMPLQRVAAIGAGGIGVVSVVVASYFGLHAKSELGDSNGNGNCKANNVCTAVGVADRASAQSAATVSTVFFIVGGAALAGGAALWFLAPAGSAHAPTPAQTSASLAPWVDPRMRAGGVVLGTDF